ncbi:MATE family efflux transporter [Clostridia bacterium]|nr:MATE family efflux transporter [Clostridia bacterium]
MFVLPMIFTGIMQQLYNIVDSLIAGNMLGDVELTAIGVSTSVMFLYLAVSTGFSIGCGVVISQYFGAKQYSHMKTAIYTAFISAIVVGIALTVIGSVFIDQLLDIMNTGDEIYKDAKDFFRVYQYSLVLIFAYNVCATVFISLGDSKMPLFFLSISIVLNIILDIYFIAERGIGVEGIAWATFSCQVVAVILSLFFLSVKLKKIVGNVKSKPYNYRTLKVMLKIAIPSVFQQSVISLGSLLVQRLVNNYSIDVTTAYYSAIKIDGLAVIPVVSVQNAISTFTAQNIGAKKYDRLNAGYKAALSIDFVLCMLLGILIFTCAPMLISVFIKDNQRAVEIGANYLHTVGGFYMVLALANTTNGVIRGYGAMKPFIGITLINLGSRVLFAYILTPIIGYKGIWWSMPLSWAVATVFALLIYKYGKWRNVGQLIDNS